MFQFYDVFILFIVSHDNCHSNFNLFDIYVEVTWAFDRNEFENFSISPNISKELKTKN